LRTSPVFNFEEPNPLFLHSKGSQLIVLAYLVKNGDQTWVDI